MVTAVGRGRTTVVSRAVTPPASARPPSTGRAGPPDLPGLWPGPSPGIEPGGGGAVDQCRPRRREGFRRLGTTAGRVFFVDDSARNVTAARDLGWRAELFTEPAALITALRVAGVPL
ncbi:hypothetical protein GCM10012284_10290 [Mangrovihabitans endophyticus]|uniref:Haloacid dehalogenase superfamily, subfamily IA, variant 3 with third motif having DD or ED n=1 Tax=Mangrovihabitans endophyticus TaxID=1751298 RepID=A0A8J3FLS3_9ACTN|nr:hypothetical protein GCM10012284_10290 [Mangrovihabitans endophyticus]